MPKNAAGMPQGPRDATKNPLLVSPIDTTDGPHLRNPPNTKPSEEQEEED